MPPAQSCAEWHEQYLKRVAVLIRCAIEFVDYVELEKVKTIGEEACDLRHSVYALRDFIRDTKRMEWTKT